MDDHDDLPVIELDGDDAPGRERVPTGTRRRLVAITAVIVVAASAIVALASRDHHHDRERTSETIVIPAPPRTTIPTADLDAESIGQMGLVAPNVGWALNGVALYRTTDDGTQWQTITPAAIPDPIGHIDALTFLDADHAWVAASAPAQPLTIWRTVDGGRSWQALRGHFCTSTVGAPACVPSVIDFVDARHGWALIDHGDSTGRLLATDDGGTTWSPLDATPFVGPLHFVDAQYGWGASGPSGDDAAGLTTDQRGAMFRTVDSGNTWQLVPPPSSANLNSPSVAMNTPQFFGPEGIVDARLTVRTIGQPSVTVYTSTDAGASWSAHSVPAPFTPAMDHIVDNRFAAATPSDWNLAIGTRLYVTHDAGSHWSTVVPTGGIVHEIAFASAQTGWILADADHCTPGAQSCPTYLLFRTHDGGATWQLTSPDAGITANRLP